jgi:hypothetical protein
MALTPTRAEGEHAPRPPRMTLVSFGREEINPDAIDHTMMRMFLRLVVDFSIEDNMKEDELRKDDPKRERHARILANLERRLERIANFETSRAAARMSRAAANNEDARRLLEARIDRFLEAKFKIPISARVE